MKVLVWSPYYPPHTGGLELYAQELHHRLSQQGHDITVFTSQLPTQPNSNQSQKVIRYPAFDLVYNFPLPKFWLPVWWRQLRIFTKQDCDLVISYTRFFASSWLALLHARLLRKPHLHIEHGSDFVTSSNPLISLCARLTDYTLGFLVFKYSTKIVAPSHSAKLFISKFISKSPQVIYRGQDYPAIDAIQPSPKLTKSNPKHLNIIYLGRLISGKNLATLIQAIAQNNNTNLHLHIVGSGPEQSILNNLVSKLSLSNQVIFHQPVPWPEAISLIKAADIVVNPSYNEGLPNLVLEASACKKAIIASDVGGAPEIITHQKTGLLFDPNSVSELRQHIDYLYNNPQARQLFGTAARQSVFHNFNWDNSLIQFNSLLQKITAQQPS